MPSPAPLTLPQIVQHGPEAALTIAIGLHDLHQPEIIDESTNLGEWTTLSTTTDQPRLTLRFNEDGEFAASSDQQFGPFKGEVSIPALLIHLHLHGQRVMHEGRDTHDEAYANIYHTIFERFSIDEFENVSVHFTEMTYNAVTILSGPDNSILRDCLAKAENALIADGQMIDVYFGNNEALLSDFTMTDETVRHMELLLGHCRSLIPRDPDNAMSHYFQDLASVIRTKKPPAAVAEAIKASQLRP